MPMLIYLIKPTKVWSYEAFAEHFFKTLNVPFEERDSANVPEGSYFSGLYQGIHFDVTMGDFTDFEDMPYTISAKTYKASDETIVDEFLRKEFVERGYKLIKYMPNKPEEDAWLEFK